MLQNLSFKQVFLLDAIGAIVTATLLSQVLARYETVFGLNSNILFILAGIACCFAVYSLSCYFFVDEKWKPFLKAIARANLLYCIITLSILFYLYSTITWLGIAYFLGEIIIILLLVRFEFNFIQFSF